MYDKASLQELKKLAAAPRGSTRPSGLKATAPDQIAAVIAAHEGKSGFSHEYALQQTHKFLLSGIGCGRSPRSDAAFVKLLNANLTHV